MYVLYCVFLLNRSLFKDSFTCTTSFLIPCTGEINIISFVSDVFIPHAVVTVQGIKNELVLVNTCSCGNIVEPIFFCQSIAMVVKHVKIRYSGHVVEFGWLQALWAFNFGFKRFMKLIYLSWKVSLSAEAFLTLQLQCLFFCRPKFQVMFLHSWLQELFLGFSVDCT